MDQIKKLIELVQQNPGLEVVIFVDSEVGDSDYAWSTGKLSNV